MRLRQPVKWNLRKTRIAGASAMSFFRFVMEEKKRGTLARNLRSLARGQMAKDMSWAELLEERAGQQPEKPMLLYRDAVYTCRQMDENANRVSQFLASLSGRPGTGLAIFMRNSPRYLDVFFGSQKIGMYTVPVNPELKGEGLAYILNHSEAQMLILDAELLDSYLEVKDSVPGIRHVIVNDVEEEAKGYDIPEEAERLSRAYASGMPVTSAAIPYNEKDICLIIYTSGTTGRPKGVVYRYNSTNVKLLTLMSGILLKPGDIYYTCLSLCHGNALFLTVTMSMGVGATIALSRKFSASRFWEEIRQYNATIFNTIGSIIPILMKQPPSPKDRENRVRVVFSAACPVEMWEPFEKRYGVRLYEGYGAVDGGGKGILNLGTAPAGALGRISTKKGKTMIVDENGTPLGPEQVGELVFHVGEGRSRVEYFKNPDASNEKVKNGWLHTGDLVRMDKKGYLYFVGRNTESMRKGGENVSAYEVEHVIMEHPDVEDAAVYAVPSELAEDEIMASVKPVNGANLDPKVLRGYISRHLARFAVPRYIRVVDEFPKTTTHRIIKRILEEEGVTQDTYDAMKEADP